MAYLILLPLILIFAALPPVHSGNCASSIQGIALSGHMYRSFITSDPLKCYHKCVQEISCRSLNFYQDAMTCELNNRTSAGRLENMRSDSRAIYFDNPYRALLGSSRLTPAISCQELKDVYSNMASGRYWVNNASGQPKEVQCDVFSGHYDAGCTNYTNITDGNRNVNYTNPTDQCDKNTAVKWYRFTGEAGVRMPTDCVPQQRCNTDAPGWLNGTHPTVQQGTVIRQVCFHWNTNCCHWNVNIRLRNCGPYYVYEFQKPPACQLRYCATF